MAERTYRNRKHEDGDAQLDVRGDEADEKGARKLERKDYEKERCERAARKAGRASRMGAARGPRRFASSSRGGMAPARAGRSKPSLPGSARASSAWSPFPRRPSGRNRKCTCSDTCRTYPPVERSRSSTAVGTIAPGVERVMGFCTGGRCQAISRALLPSRESHSQFLASSCSSIGSKVRVPRSRKGGSGRASTTGARSGSFPRWTCSPFPAGTITRERATKC